jgi:hypothetical protein
VADSGHSMHHPWQAKGCHERKSRQLWDELIQQGSGRRAYGTGETRPRYGAAWSLEIHIKYAALLQIALSVMDARELMTNPAAIAAQCRRVNKFSPAAQKIGSVEPLAPGVRFYPLASATATSHDAITTVLCAVGSYSDKRR